MSATWSSTTNVPDVFVSFVTDQDNGRRQRVAWLRARCIVAFVDFNPIDPYAYTEPTTVRCRVILDNGESVQILGSATESVRALADVFGVADDVPAP